MDLKARFTKSEDATPTGARSPVAVTAEAAALLGLVAATVWLGQLVFHNTVTHPSLEASELPQVAPLEIPATSLAGESVVLPLEGRPRGVVLLVLSTSCQYCAENMAPWRQLLEAVRSLGPQAPEVLALSVSSAAETRAFLLQHDVDVEALLIDRSVLELLGLRGYPSTVTIRQPTRSLARWDGVLDDQQQRTLLAWARTAASDTQSVQPAGMSMQ